MPFALLSDEDRKVADSFGVPVHLGRFPAKSSFVIDPEGVIRHVYDWQFRPRHHVAKNLGLIVINHGVDHMQWRQVLSDAGLSDREVNAVMVLSTKSSLKASELAKELGTTRLDAYNSLERLQSIGLVKTIADRPMRFSCPPVHEAVSHLIDIRREQLQKIETGYEDLKQSVNPGEDQTNDETSDFSNPKFAVLKERTHIMNRIDKMANEAESELTLVLGRFGILHLCRSSQRSTA